MRNGLINKKEIKLYDEWNRARYISREDKDNICPIGLSDSEFIEIMKNIFLGHDWCIVMPLGHNQINEEILEDILFKITRETPNERC